MKTPTPPLSLFLLGILTLSTDAADWPQFRGPGGLGVAQDKDLPTTWSADRNVAWKTALPGAGASSPIVVGKKILVTCYSGYGVDKGGDMRELKRHLVCLDLDGNILWTRDVKAELPEVAYKGYQALHGYASSTPASDGQRVYVFFGKSGVLAYDLEGKQLWHKSAGTRTNSWGSGTSPVLYKDLVIVNASVESGKLVAFKTKDGAPAWTAAGMSSSWNTPLLVEVGGKQELVVSVQGRLRGFDPASGKDLWNCRGIDDYVCPSVIAHDGVVYAIGARANTAIAVKAGGRGDVSDSHAVWRIRKGSNVSSPVYYEGRLYWANDSRGTVYCVKASNGEVVYEKQLKPGPDRIYASPLAAAGKIYYVSRKNGAYVVQAGPEFKLVAHNTLGDTSVFNASIAVSAGRLLLRSDRYLYCIGKK